ncbi:DUF6949 family protein [Hansschlegelia sp.]|uniref:DUF6949 family protein n=1 Tax=Hansschlegelia sp. TaxID=2041892 RepID=UPI002BF0A134|nr:hypothetical protein [Hansschlegelia sp.]HVI28200.1 hypothetical protein [Hansschlegelia sp.]
MSFLTAALTLALGFAISGAAASAFEAVTERRASFGLLREPDVIAAAAVPVVTIGASYILARNLLFGARRPAWAVCAGTVLLGGWSLVLGAAALAAFVG